MKPVAGFWFSACRTPVALLLVVLAAGCGLLKRVPNQFYSLDTLPSQTARATTVSGTPIGIDAIELPPGLDRKGIVVRGADHKFEVRGQQQWASSLEEMVLHTLAFDLANRLPEGMVVLPGQSKPGTMRSISINFEDLASGPEKEFVLDARWTIEATTHHERIAIALASDDSPAIATAMSQALATLADRIASSV